MKNPGEWIVFGLLCLIAVEIMILRGTVEPKDIQHPESLQKAEKQSIVYSPLALGTGDSRELPVRDTGENIITIATAVPTENGNASAAGVYVPASVAKPTQKEDAEAVNAASGSAVTADAAVSSTAAPAAETPVPDQATSAPATTAPATSAPSPTAPPQGGASSYYYAPQGDNETPRI